MGGTNVFHLLSVWHDVPGRAFVPRALGAQRVPPWIRRLPQVFEWEFQIEISQQCHSCRKHLRTFSFEFTFKNWVVLFWICSTVGTFFLRDNPRVTCSHASCMRWGNELDTIFSSKHFYRTQTWGLTPSSFETVESAWLRFYQLLIFHILTILKLFVFC